MAHSTNLNLVTQIGDGWETKGFGEAIHKAWRKQTQKSQKDHWVEN
jgi:hypothetical protein